MRKLGDQWVEEFDGKNHMLKAMENTTGGCKGCDLQVVENCYGSCGAGDGCNFIIKDLGVLNEHGLLPSPFPDGGYPTIQRGANWGDGEWVDCYWAVYKAHKIYICTGQFPTEQEAIDAWNRRA